MVCHVPGAPLPDEQDDDGAAEIEAEFRRRIMGLRRLRPYERAGAVRAARNWKTLALRALREKRAANRSARRMLWLRQQQTRRLG